MVQPIKLEEEIHNISDGRLKATVSTAVSELLSKLELKERDYDVMTEKHIVGDKEYSLEEIVERLERFLYRSLRDDERNKAVKEFVKKYATPEK